MEAMEQKLTEKWDKNTQYYRNLSSSSQAKNNRY